MQPYLKAEVTEADQAYIIATLQRLDGRTAEARRLANRFLAGGLTPYWQARLEQFKASLPEISL